MVDHAIISCKLKLTFNLDIVSINNKMRSIVNNLGRALVKKRALTLGSKDINIIDNTTVFDNYKGNLEQKVFKNI